jgi:hypothetical protein
MMEILAGLGLSPAEWALGAVCGILVGLAKTGVSGAFMLGIPIMAAIFGPRESTGVVLPMLCAGDLFAVFYYHRHADWAHLVRLLPWALAGIAVGVWVGEVVSRQASDDAFGILIAGVVLVGLAGMVLRERRGKDLPVPESRWFGRSLGLTGGFATMVGNAAGPIMAMYLLAMRLPKNVFIGTAAWFFTVVNLCKIPLHLFIWETIDGGTLAFDAMMVPAIALGAFLGVTVIRRVPERPFRILVMVMTGVAAIRLLWISASA